MSISVVRTFLDTRMKALNFVKWDDGFNFENIPENILDKAYHIMVLEAGFNPSAVNQVDLTIEAQFTVRVFFKGYQSPEDAIDLASDKLVLILEDVLQPSRRLTIGSNVRDLKTTGATIEPVAFSNDNHAMLTIGFVARIGLNTCT